MLPNDERFRACPELPQYGNLIASCVANLPRLTNLWAKAGITLLLFVGIFVIMVLLGMMANRSLAPGRPVNTTVVNAFAFTTAIAACFALQFGKPARKSDAIFVFEGGIHLNENVLYTVPGGSHRMSVCSAMRQVSLPWRVLTNFQIQKTQRHGQTHLQASFRIPDGRTMEVASYSGEEAVLAIQKLHQQLGSK
ncbi:MAG: hypothetical protein IT423_20885 [Pirellulaceae bacterium]|nr:hypothetical protein [Pirellulaceae bacterium]